MLFSPKLAKYIVLIGSLGSLTQMKHMVYRNQHKKRESMGAAITLTWKQKKNENNKPPTRLESRN